MGKKRTPSPEPAGLKTTYGCGSMVLLLSALVTTIAFYTRTWWLLLACVPGLGITAYWTYGRLLLLLAVLVYKPHNIVGVLITSDSPNWHEYIQQHWIERFGNRFVILNWSQRKKWGTSLAARLFSHFDSFDENFCPAVIYLRGFRHPLIFRCCYAFRDHKHGNVTALQDIERRLFQELDIELKSP